ncbi:toxic anion resistance protein [Sinomonas sp. ASV322]|uniref:toxic anion resistance protein n=1 Tax=Sinomonas sp. ASV322 TaxID=3041920 RepID=UPI0027DCCE28|nr:toxic anion resistance protein [Sinomonas sp. ASV322]MDQ4503394.1 toxic anion resistance protein [Sinomonas sp. ASV322]
MSTPLTPPDPTEDALVLEAPDATPVIREEDAPGMVPVAADRQSEIAAQAKAWVAEVAAMDSRSPEFARKVEGLHRVGGREIIASSDASGRLLDRASTSIRGAKKTGDTAQTYVASTLGELRSTVESLTPNRADLGTSRKILGFVPGGNKVAKYFQRYESAQTQLDRIIKALMAGQDELLRDNAALAQEKGNLWEVMQQLSEYAVFAQELDGATAAKITEVRAAGQTEHAQQLEADVLFPIRQRRQDILTQLAVSVQGYLAIDVIRKNNNELIKGVDRARATTVSALRTAVITAQALSNQKLVLDQIDAINTTTNAMILKTSEMLKDQTSRIHQQATSSGVSVETLERAFANIYQTMDAIDAFRSQAARSMESTVHALEEGLEKARPHIERVRRQEGNAG